MLLQMTIFYPFLWLSNKMEYYSAIKKKEIMSSAATWMDLEIITLSEVGQTETYK